MSRREKGEAVTAGRERDGRGTVRRPGRQGRGEEEYAAVARTERPGDHEHDGEYGEYGDEDYEEYEDGDRYDDEEYDEDEDHDDERHERAAPARRRRVSATQAAQAALGHITGMTGKSAEGVTSVRPEEDGWIVGVELLDARHIPSSSDTLALYRVEIDAGGELTSYQRVGRYSRARGSSEAS